MRPFSLWRCRGSKRDSTFENILKRPLMFPAKPVVSQECQVSFSIATHSSCTSQVRNCRSRLRPQQALLRSLPAVAACLLCVH